MLAGREPGGPTDQVNHAVIVAMLLLARIRRDERAAAREFGRTHAPAARDLWSLLQGVRRLQEEAAPKGS
jgi:hypothetical protein